MLLFSVSVFNIGILQRLVLSVIEVWKLGFGSDRDAILAPSEFATCTSSKSQILMITEQWHFQYLLP